VRIAAGVLHYRFWPGVRETLDGLLTQTRQPDQVVVMDHASDDGSSAQIRAAYPELEVVELTENRGPTAGMNQLLRALLARSADAVFILPHDLRLAPDALHQLAARLEEEPTLGAAGPLIALQEEPDRVFYAGGYVRRHNWSLDFREVPAAVSEWRGRLPHPVDFLEFGGILIRSQAARATGFLPERFYYWADDVDYTLRIGSLGWRLECVPAAVAWQELGHPPPYLVTRNTLGLIARNAPRRFLARELVRTVYWLVRDTIRPPEGTRADIRARFRGLLDFCLNRWGPPPGQAV
jgi:GT2 family glycosyltransferase